MVMQDTKFAWADDELPTRREERERERQQAERGPTKPAQPTAATLRELEPPRAFTKVDESTTPSPSAGSFGTESFGTESFATNSSGTDPAGTDPYDARSFDYRADEAAPSAAQTPPVPSFESLFDTQPAAHGDQAQQSPTIPSESLDDIFGASTETQPQYETRRAAARGTADRDRRATATPNGNPLVSTAPAWIIAMVPLFQLVLSLLLLTALGMGSNSTVFIAILAAPYFIVIALAFADFRMLKRQGVERPAHWTWALLTAPVYLLARARNVIRESGHGIGPVLVWFGLGALHLASVVAIPGLLIVVLPGIFTSQLEASVEGDALLISGASMSVTCPVTPPVIFGEQTVCTAISSSGKNSEVSVSLERANGWIEWQVLDWGVWDMER